MAARRRPSTTNALAAVAAATAAPSPPPPPPASVSKSRAAKKKASSSSRSAPPPYEPLVYTAQDVARFCEVDLKTIHHWADAGKIAHHRTEGRHLRFRRNHVVQFLRTHGYPLHAKLTTARPTIFVSEVFVSAVAALSDDVFAALATHFNVRRFASAIQAVAYLVSDAPDALLFSMQDSTITSTALAALKADAATAWIAFVTMSDDAASAIQNVDLVVPTIDLQNLPLHLATHLAIEVE